MVSHDQKLGKVRVVGGQVAAINRRKDDTTSTHVISGESEPTKNEGSRSQLLLAALFMTSCAIGGAALPLVRAG